MNNFSSSIFPLPVLSLPFFSSSTSRRCIQRAYRSRSLVLLVNATIQALNYLFNKKSIFKNSQHHNISFKPSIQQQRVLNHLFKYCKRFYSNNTPTTYNNTCRRNYFMSDIHTIQHLTSSFLKSFNSSFFNVSSSSSNFTSSEFIIDDNLIYTKFYYSR
jgi:hypothetical protein